MKSWLLFWILCIASVTYSQTVPHFIGIAYHHAQAYKLNAGYEPPSAKNGVALPNSVVKQLNYILNSAESFQTETPANCPLFEKLIFFDEENREVASVAFGLDCGRIVLVASQSAARVTAQGLNESAANAIYDLLSDIFVKLKPILPNKTKPTSYIVQAGDTWTSIAEAYGTSIELLCAANGKMSYEKLRTGSKLLVYKGVQYYAYAKKPTTPSSTSNSSTAKTHTVQAKETLYAISKKYGTTVLELQKVNNLPDNNLKIGQVLKIPVKK